MKKGKNGTVLYRPDIIDALVIDTQENKKELVMRVNRVFEYIKIVLQAGNEVNIKNFGTFKMIRRKPKLHYDTNLKIKYKLPERLTPSFKPSEKLRADLTRWLGEIVND